MARIRRFEIFRRDGFTCRYCGEGAPDVKLHVDHIYPRSLGGSDDPTNLVTACATCNIAKGARPLDAEKLDNAEFIQATKCRDEIERFDKAWRKWTESDSALFDRGHPWVEERPEAWRAIVAAFVGMGIAGDDMESLLDRAMAGSWGHNYAWQMYVGFCKALHDVENNLTSIHEPQPRVT